MQLRFATDLAGEDYVRSQAWRSAQLPRCPLHPRGGCSFARHGTYRRVTPQGCRIARWYCPQGHCTFSLLPDFLASHLSGSLADLEQTVVRIEQSDSLEAAADALRADDITLPSAIRWARRRLVLVREALKAVIRALPGRFARCQPSATAFRHHLMGEHALLRLRALPARHLQAMPAPLGFAPQPPSRVRRGHADQHEMGPDPPVYWR